MINLEDDPLMQKLQKNGYWDLAHFVANAFLTNGEKKISFADLRHNSLMVFSEVYGHETPKFEPLANILKEEGVINYAGELDDRTPIELTDFGRNYFLKDSYK